MGPISALVDVISGLLVLAFYVFIIWCCFKLWKVFSHHNESNEEPEDIRSV